MQNLKPVGLGPSSNTCPKCASQLLQRTSILLIPWERSTSVTTASFENGLLKLGHPDPLSNLLDEENNLLEQQMQRNSPDSLGNPWCEKGGSVSPS